MLVFGVNTSLLFEVIWQSIVAGIFVALLFSLVVLFGARSAEARRSGHAATATAWLVAAVLSLAVYGAIVIAGVQVMLSKE
jgi:hypothetical protein